VALGAGLARRAGDVRTLVAIPIALLLDAYASEAAFVATIVVLFVLGTWAAQVTGRRLRPDHGSIVIDEVAAFLLVLYFTGLTPLRIAIAFALFRFFDIVKPPPIRQLDAAMKNGLGVMLDDMLAALYALVIFAIGQRVIG
jgi:phosphatidylglycerophosphatase A